MKKKTQIQKIAEITWQKVLKNHEHYFKESYFKPYFERLKKVRFDRFGNIVGAKDSKFVTFNYKVIYTRWQKLFEEAKAYVKNNL